MSKEEYMVFVPDLSSFLSALCSFFVSLASVLAIHAIPVQYWVFPVALSRAWHVGPQRRGKTCD